MKNILLTAILGSLAATSYAQTPIKAGTVQLGGNVGYSQYSTDNSYLYYTGSGYINTTQHTANKGFSINPMAGYFIADNLSVGLGFGYSSNKTIYTYDSNYISGSEQRSEQLNLGVFAQYYRLFTDQFGLVGTLNAGYSHGTGKTIADNNGSRNTINGIMAFLTPSIVFFPVPKFSAGASIGGVGYTHYTTKTEVDSNVLYDSTGTSSSFGASFGLSYLAFNGTYYFGR